MSGEESSSAQRARRFFENPGAAALRASRLPPVSIDATAVKVHDALRSGRAVVEQLAKEARVSSDDVELLCRRLHASKSGGGNNLDWNNRREVLAFSLAYWELNFWKAYAALERLRPNINGLGVDIGAGTGAASAASLVYAASNGQRVTKWIAVDQSRTSIDVCREVLAAVGGAIESPVPILAHKGVLRDVTSAMGNDRAAFVVASHVIAGQPEAAKKLVELASNEVLAPGARMMIIERPHDREAVQALSSVTDRRHALTRYRYAIDLVSKPSQPGHQIAPDIYGIIVYDLERPRSELAATVSDEYFRSLWVNKSVGMIRRLFAPDARYTVLADDRYPADRTWEGWSGIEGYWADKVLVQLETDVVTGESIHDGHLSAFDFAGRFRLPDRDEVIHGRMTHEFETRDGVPRIHTLTEAYEFHRAEHLPPPQFFLS